MKKIFGFSSWYDFSYSLIKPKILMYTSPFIVFMATILSYTENIVGIKGPIVMAFIGLNMAEWGTGLWVSIHRGQAFSSMKFFRAVFKTFIYVLMLAIVHQMKNMDAAGFSDYLFTWTHWAIFTALSIILLRSVFENLHDVGVKEASALYAILNNKYTRIITGEPVETEKK